MITSQNSKRFSRVVLMTLLSIGLGCIVVAFTIRLTSLDEVEKLPAEQLLQQYWHDEQSASSPSSQEDDHPADQSRSSDESNETDVIAAEPAFEVPAVAPSQSGVAESEASPATNQQVTSEGTEEQSMDTNKIDINTATAQQLQQLKGIGPSKAQAIVDDREQKGKFKRIEDIKRVKGIGEKLYAGIQESIVASQ